MASSATPLEQLLKSLTPEQLALWNQHNAPSSTPSENAVESKHKTVTLIHQREDFIARIELVDNLSAILPAKFDYDRLREPHPSPATELQGKLLTYVTVFKQISAAFETLSTKIKPVLRTSLQKRLKSDVKCFNKLSNTFLGKSLKFQKMKRELTKHEEFVRDNKWPQFDCTHGFQSDEEHQTWADNFIKNKQPSEVISHHDAMEQSRSVRFRLRVSRRLTVFATNEMEYFVQGILGTIETAKLMDANRHSRGVGNNFTSTHKSDGKSIISDFGRIGDYCLSLSFTGGTKTNKDDPKKTVLEERTISSACLEMQSCFDDLRKAEKHDGVPADQRQADKHIMAFNRACKDRIAVLLKMRTGEQYDGVTRCWNSDCEYSQWYIYDIDEDISQCPNHHRKCTKCDGEQHEGDCPERVDFLGDRIKHCPNPACQIPIEHFTGCHHIHCTRCQWHFCWLCKIHFADYVNRNNTGAIYASHYTNDNHLLYDPLFNPANNVED